MRSIIKFESVEHSSTPLKSLDEYYDWVVMNGSEYYHGAHGAYCLMEGMPLNDFMTKAEAEALAKTLSDGAVAVKISADDAMSEGFYRGISHQKNNTNDDLMDDLIYSLKEKFIKFLNIECDKTKAVVGLTTSNKSRISPLRTGKARRIIRK